MLASNFRMGTARACLSTLVLALVLGLFADSPAAAQQGGIPSFCSCIGKVSGSRELIYAVCSGNVQEAKRLVCQGADVNSAITAIQCPDDCEQHEQVNITALMIAAWRGDRGISEILLCKGADKNAVTQMSSKPFSARDFAAMHRHDKTTGYIKNYSPHVKCPDLKCEEFPPRPPSEESPGGGREIWVIDSTCWHLPPCNKAGSKPHLNPHVTRPVGTSGCLSGRMALHICCGADPNAIILHSTPCGPEPVLTSAAEHCCTNQVKILLGENQYNTEPANVNFEDTCGCSALWWNARQCKKSGGCVETARVLLNHGANVNNVCEGYRGMSVLIKAAEIGCSKEYIKLLLDSGADPKIKDKWGKTALDYAKDPEIQELLKQYGAKK